jgi:1-acylglycerone phosphate reductase
MSEIVYDSPAIEADPQIVQTMFSTNVFGLFNMVTSFTPLLLSSIPNSTSTSHPPPIIINISSIVSRVPVPLTAHYNATKAAVSSYSDTLRLELAPLGIKVVTVIMGIVSTNIVTPNPQFAPSSFYTSLLPGLKKRTENHLKNGQAPEEFAKQIVADVLRTPVLGKGEFLWRGGSAFVVWLLYTFGYKKIFDSSLEGALGLTREAKREIFERGRTSVQELERRR